MSLVEWTYVLAGCGILAIYAGAVYVAWRALFGDRGRERRRCPRCWHDLSHTPNMTCSECGFIGHDESDFKRTRRRWNVAGLAILACVLLAGWLYWTLADRGMLTYMPTRVIVAALPISTDTTAGPHRELARRIRMDRVSEGSWTALMKRCAQGDWQTSVLSDNWKLKYGELVRSRRWMVSTREGAEWHDGEVESLLSIPAEVTLTTRSEWPVGMSPRVRMDMRNWWPLGGECRVRLTPKVENPEPITVYRSAGARPWVGYSFAVDGIPANATSIDLQVDIERRPGLDEVPEDAEREWRLMSRETMSVKTAFTSAPDAGLEPVTDTALTQAIWETFSHGVVRWPRGPSKVRFFFRPQSTYQAEFNDVAVGVHVDVLKGDDLARRLDLWWLAGVTPTDRGSGWEAEGEDPGLLDEIDDGPDWIMRVTGDARIALRAGDAKKYWSGELFIPISVDQRTGNAPRRDWWQKDTPEAPDSSGEGDQ